MLWWEIEWIMTNVIYCGVCDEVATMKFNKELIKIAMLEYQYIIKINKSY